MNGSSRAVNAIEAWNDMHTTIDEIADGIYRISTFVPDVTPVGFTFNQFLVAGDEPLLFHAGHRGMFPLVAEAVAKVCRSSRCAGSASGTSRPTSAGR